MSSRERILAAIRHERPDRTPICFRGIAPKEIYWKTPLERAYGLLSLGADDKLSVEVPWRLPPEVAVTQRWEKSDSEEPPTIAKSFETPKGTLRLSFRESPDFIPCDVPIRSDHTWSRGKEYPVDGEEDIEAIRYIFSDPSRVDLTAFREHVARVKSFADVHGVFVEGNITHYAGLLGNLVGPNSMLLSSIDSPDYIRTILEIIHDWSMKQMEILLDCGVDAIYSSGSYETTELWSPEQIRDFFLPLRRENADLAHRHDAFFHYFTQTGMMPIIDDYAEIGIDILSGLDPIGVGGRHAADLYEIRKRIGDRVCIWGGVSAPITLEMGTKEDIRTAVQSAIEACTNDGLSGGFVLSTSGSVYQINASTDENIDEFIRAGLELGKLGG